ncbi:hypothetical protein RHSIM_RhsimUnG0201700 [Rhododendron simsii]|uniref:NB-ARC domain-containing protein n=1 Tax=Rhododendron simsii TaxID=118357 RepID=A0A834FTR0_RHOSS|nr:hypothetical protein RHSIM_RhsimUnG0201700 [Rhododendron simsii]
MKSEMLVDRAPEPVIKREGPDIRKFETLQKPLEKIMDWLKRYKVKGIGIYGTVGIGKTTIMLNLNNHDQFKGNWDSFKQLWQQNSDVKEYLNLKEIGIPLSNNGSKIVLTTRLRDVCNNEMVDKAIKVAYLSPDESWKMFQDVLGSKKLIADLRIWPLAWQVRRECSGLPLLIEKVANTFKLKNTESLWSDGLNSWRLWPSQECKGIREIYELLRFCYNELGDDGVAWEAENLLGNGNDARKVIDVKSSQQWTNEVVEKAIKEVATLRKFKGLKVCFPNRIVDVIEVAPMTVRILIPEATILMSYIRRSLWGVVKRIGPFRFFIGCQKSEYLQNPDFVRYKIYVKYCNVLAAILQFLSSDAIETIMDMVGSELLPNLEQLFVKNLPMLKSIWKEGPLQHGSLTKLTSLVVSGFQILVKVFPLGAIQQLREIRYLKIEKCDEVEDIIPEADAAGNLPVLPKLEELILIDMEKLSSICAIESLEWPSLEKLEIFGCPSLCSLPFNEGNSTYLDVSKQSRSGGEHWSGGEHCSGRIKSTKKAFRTYASSAAIVYDETVRKQSIVSENSSLYGDPHSRVQLIVLLDRSHIRPLRSKA